MFDTVGRGEQDPEAIRRHSLSFVLTVFVCTTGLGAVVLRGMMLVVDSPLMRSDEADMVEVVLEDEKPEVAPPPPAPPPPPPPAARVDPEVVPKVEPKPTEEPQELQEKVPEKVAETPAVPVANEQGVEGGEVGGKVGGVVGGRIEGQIGGSVLGVRTFHQSELRVKERVAPKYPQEAKKQRLAEVDCQVRLFIDETGAPYDLKFESCPEMFHGATREAVMQWRWYPAEFEGTPIKAQFKLNVKYKLS